MTLELSCMCQNITWSLPHSLWSKGPLSLAANRSEATNAGGDRKTWRFGAIPLADSSSYIYIYICQWGMFDYHVGLLESMDGWLNRQPSIQPIMLYTYNYI